VAELIKFCEANMKAARKAASDADNLAGHAFYTGQAAAFEAVVGYCKLAIMNEGVERCP
jgi:23S rRNA maturation mini-RNase III